MKKTSAKYNAVLFAVFLPLLLAAFIRTAGFQGENSIDCYYHIYMADAGPALFTARVFPKVTMSVWANNFSDKELGFHFLLYAVRGVKRFFGLDLSPPFDVESLFFVFLLIFVFVWILEVHQVRYTLYYTLMLIIISPFFLNRILMLRPHTLSVTLVLAGFSVMCGWGGKKQLWSGFAAGFIFAWSYSNPHFILLPAAAAGLAGYLKEKKSTALVLLPLFVTLGVLAGMTVHPQFPNTFVNWKIQCIDVIRQALFHSLPVAVGAEFHRPGMIWLLKNSVPFIIFLFSLYLIWNIRRRNGGFLQTFKHLLSIQTIAAGITAAVTLAGVFAGIRVMEYACPFSIIFTAFLLNDCRRHGIALPSPFLSVNIPLYTRILILVLSGSALVFYTHSYCNFYGFRPFDKFADFAGQKRIPPDALIANPVWSDFTRLVYSCPQYRYLSGLDPMFSYALYPETMKKLYQFRTGRIALTPEELREITGAEYAFLSARCKVFSLYMRKLGYRQIYHGEDGWCFELGIQDGLPLNNGGNP